MSKIPIKLKTKVSGAQNVQSAQIILPPNMCKQTWTFTFCESAENHVGMQILGQKAKTGFSLSDLEGAKKIAEDHGLQVEMVNLHPNLPAETNSAGLEAYVLVIRQGWKLFFNDNEYDQFLRETKDSEKIVDKKAWMKGRVVNKKARYNLCYADFSQQPNYEEKKGTVVDFKDVTYLNKVREGLPKLVGEKGKNLFAEMNYYYDISQTGISPHGDSERRLVIGFRVGASMKLRYQWFLRFKTIGVPETINLNGGDIYIMSDKAVGNDWKRSIIPTLRHSAGADKFTNPK